MFYISAVDGKSISYDPVAFRENGDVDRLHQSSRSPQTVGDAVVLEASEEFLTQQARETYSLDAHITRAEVTDTSTIGGEIILETEIR